MDARIEALAVTLLAGIGVLLGIGSSKLRRPYWTIGYFIPLALVLVFVWANHDAALAWIPPFSWLLMGRNKFAVFGFAVAMVLTTPLSRLPRKRDRVVVSVLAAIAVWQLSVWPFLAPAFNRDYLRGLHTRIDADGVCLQSNGYTCGPAAAVTALRKLGFPAEEGELAIAAHTSSSVGTPPDILANALRKRYGNQGLEVDYRLFKNLDELRRAGLTLVVVEFNFWIDHFVAVLEVTDDSVIVGDPLTGRTVLSREEFEKKWYSVGVVLRRSK